MAITYTRQQADRLSGSVYGTQCCGVSEFSGMDLIRNDSDAKAVRAGAYMANTSGVVLATITGRQARHRPDLIPMLKRGGFRKHRSFRNPNTGQDITLMSAPTLRRYGSRRDAEYQQDHDDRDYD